MPENAPKGLRAFFLLEKFSCVKRKLLLLFLQNRIDPEMETSDKVALGFEVTGAMGATMKHHAKQMLKKEPTTFLSRVNNPNSQATGVC